MDAATTTTLNGTSALRASPRTHVNDLPLSTHATGATHATDSPYDAPNDAPNESDADASRAVTPRALGEGASARSSGIADVCEATRALAQAATTLVLGALTTRLGGATVGAGMTAMSLSRVNFRVLATQTPLTLGAIGASLVAVAAACGLVVSRHDAGLAKEVAARARRRVLVAALADPTAADVGALGAAIAWPAAMEADLLAARARRRATLQLGASAIAIAWLDPWLASVVVALLVPFALSLATVRRTIRARAAEGASQLSDVVTALRDLVEHAPLWAVTGGGDVALARVDLLGATSARLARRTATAASMASAWNELVASLAICFLVAAFGPEGWRARPTLVPVLLALLGAYRPLRELTESAPARAAGNAARTALDARTSNDRAPTRSLGRRWPEGSLCLDNVTLDVGGPELRAGVDLRADRGEIIALSGPPGAGKSSLLEAIAGVRALASGSIRLGEIRIDTRGVGPEARPIAWSPASAAVLPGTLLENLAPDAPRDEARTDRARDILARLGDEALATSPGETSLGPGGRRLSAGEAQRLGLARALASDAVVQLLDEPTANLDDVSEQRVIREIKASAARGAIVLVASHRARVCAAATKTVVLRAFEAP